MIKLSEENLSKWPRCWTSLFSYLDQIFLTLWKEVQQLHDKNLSYGWISHQLWATSTYAIIFPRDPPARIVFPPSPGRFSRLWIIVWIWISKNVTNVPPEKYDPSSQVMHLTQLHDHCMLPSHASAFELTGIFLKGRELPGFIGAFELAIILRPGSTVWVAMIYERTPSSYWINARNALRFGSCSILYHNTTSITGR